MATKKRKTATERETANVTWHLTPAAIEALGISIGRLCRGKRFRLAFQAGYTIGLVQAPRGRVRGKAATS